MVLNGLVILLVVGIGMLWAIRGKGRGLFSAFLNFVCVVAAGAIAFGLWEPVTLGLLLTGEKGFVEDIAWGAGLMLPFFVSLGLLRLAVELLIPKNVYVSDAGNFVGGLAFGGGAGIITAGIVVIGLQFMRFGPTLMGFDPVDDDQGNIAYEKSLWVPVDKWTGALYSHLSAAAFSTPTPLAERSPNVAERAAFNRAAFSTQAQKGTPTGRVTLQPEQFDVLGRYVVRGPSIELRADTFQPDAPPQNVRYPSGDPAPGGDAVLQGYVLRFNAAAGEEKGQVVMTQAQARLVIRERGGVTRAIHPFAFIAQPEAAAGGKYRFRFEASGIVVPSVGGASETSFAFEFLLPPDAQATDLFVKNVRIPLPATMELDLELASIAARDDGVRDGSLFGEFGAGGAAIAEEDIDRSDVREVTMSGDRGEIVSVSDAIPNRWIINKTLGTGGLSVDEDNFITGGQHSFTVESLTGRGADLRLRVSRFATTRDTAMVIVELSNEGARSVLGRVVEAAENVLPPLLRDAAGRTYQAVGFVYGDGQTVTIRYTPDRPMRALSELPERLTQAKRNQTAYLLFRPTAGVELTGFLLGNQLVGEFDEPVIVGRTRRR